MARVQIEVVSAERESQRIVALSLEEGARAIDAVRASGLASVSLVVSREAPRLGIFGRIVAPDTVLQDGDRVEIYRPVHVDPKAARHAKAAGRPARSRTPPG